MTGMAPVTPRDPLAALWDIAAGLALASLLAFLLGETAASWVVAAVVLAWIGSQFVRAHRRHQAREEYRSRTGRRP